MFDNLVVTRRAGRVLCVDGALSNYKRCITRKMGVLCAWLCQVAVCIFCILLLVLSCLVPPELVWCKPHFFFVKHIARCQAWWASWLRWTCNVRSLHVLSVINSYLKDCLLCG